jgi:general secretion pathway protein K
VVVSTPNFSERGAILVPALWALVILSVLVTGFGYRMSVEVGIADLRQEQLRARWLARSGIRMALFALAEDESTEYDSRSEAWYNNSDLYERYELDDGYFSVTAIRSDDGGVPRFGIVDEESKINLNTASIEILERVFEDNEEVVPAILDWRDADDHVLPGGAEATFYAGLESPYPCRNGALSMIDEIQLVRGVTPEVVARVRGLVTTYGEGRVNINTCGGKVLECLGLSEDVVDAVLLHRAGPDGIDGTEDDMIFEKVDNIRADLTTNIGLEADDLSEIDRLVTGEYFTVRSCFFTIHAVGVTTAGSAQHEITTVVERQGQDMPLVVYWYES